MSLGQNADDVEVLAPFFNPHDSVSLHQKLSAFIYFFYLIHSMSHSSEYSSFIHQIFMNIVLVFL